MSQELLLDLQVFSVGPDYYRVTEEALALRPVFTD